MAEHDEKKTSQTEPENSGEPTPVAPDERRARSRKIWRDLWVGLLIIALLFLVKLWVEQTTLGHQFHLMSYNLLQTQLSTDPKTVPVYVIDITDLTLAPYEADGEKFLATPREPLINLAKAAALSGATAIGIDVDFSPNERGWITNDDPRHFQSFLDISRETGVPIFLGIKRSQTLSSELWLGDEDYQELAANIVIPDDSRKMLEWTQAGAGAKPGLTMSAALAHAFKESKRDVPEWLHWAVEQVSEKKVEPGFSVGEFLVDYSPLETLVENHRIRTFNAEVVKDQGWLLAGKIVLIGDGDIDEAGDLFSVPGRQQLFPGIYLHACAAYTILQAHLYELTPKGRLLVDLLLSVPILALIIGLRFYYRDRTHLTVAGRRLQYILTLLVVAGALVVGVVFVRVTRVMWDDFMLALFALWLHPSVERNFEKFGKWSRKIGAAIHKVVFVQKDEEENES